MESETSSVSRPFPLLAIFKKGELETLDCGVKTMVEVVFMLDCDADFLCLLLVALFTRSGAFDMSTITLSHQERTTKSKRSKISSWKRFF